MLTICQTRKLQLTWIHFSEMSNTIFTSEIPEADTFVENHDFSEECYNDDSQLNSPITVNENLEAVKTLKRSKSCGNDILLNDYFIESVDILSGHLCDIFNGILNSGFSPEEWTCTQEGG